MKRIEYTTESLLPLLESKKLKALVPYPGSVNKRWKCQCLQCGKEIAPTLGSLRRGLGCKSCNPKIKYTHESLLPLLELKNLKPLTPYPGNTNKPWKFECLICGKEVQKSLHSLKESKWMFLIKKGVTILNNYSVTKFSESSQSWPR